MIFWEVGKETKIIKGGETGTFDRQNQADPPQDSGKESMRQAGIIE